MANLKTSLLVAGAVVLLVAVFWWIQPNFWKKEPVKEPVKVQYQVAAGGANELRAQVIKKYGIDKKHGIDFEIVTTDPGELERRIANGESYLADISPFTILAAKQKNINLLVISPSVLYRYHVLVSIDSHIASVQELKGKKIGTQPKVTAAYIATAIALKAGGIDVEKDVSMVFGNIPQTAAAVEKGEADAAMVAYPPAASLIASGKFKSAAALGDIWSQKEGGLVLPFVALVANKDWYEHNKDTAKRAVETILDAGRFIQERPSAISELTDYLNKYNLNTPPIRALLETNSPKQFPNNYGEKEVMAFERYFAQAKELKIIPADAPMDSFLVKPSELGL
ncbi:MAG: ABC nitrate/sulfonate/bicarbonate family transporter, periplasmic ligand binding protein [Candidatus Giovannonibacteria bacterium GW2011_GWC2_44_9]|uniref:ABC nitrate/sulfonate/bicarbonate family transporter, periplasmic ligand binding protein n=3 Tax=Candidatus Giovannoniibacteriota TaxID=1752738 RepID=A0A0G1L2V2_9BACT|nr:MAG: ABC nitrate/sulfonate/bicarbonate family transporter, periplasmic ligand binding protein [Candidatus Giovannonibacteria bacterium GW2011_GWB1_44_23]KKT62947.1 MAG: ABC nitrate/sulfonate/bicarbonate family transporter, periplasmic ligand binding protein [Candidatus Giovannonibacteria bacterium GW2011_GWA1_44_29]KKT83352.1 MAG: ABC nitrate/sulfonate/bicarbonate family transporter, periplasmic ligand binding protein [Candidatus Giovannonibacteria bacterium GW2011_GWC2_44_9]KKT91490.1 MAG: A